MYLPNHAVSFGHEAVLNSIQSPSPIRLAASWCY